MSGVAWFAIVQCRLRRVWRTFIFSIVLLAGCTSSVLPDDAASPCHTNADCPDPSHAYCLFEHAGCDAMGRCSISPGDVCHHDGGWFCSCEGRTVGGVVSCGPSPVGYVAFGTCESLDAAAMQ